MVVQEVFGSEHCSPGLAENMNLIEPELLPDHGKFAGKIFQGIPGSICRFF
jgi:hypothetical protein